MDKLLLMILMVSNVAGECLIPQIICLLMIVATGLPELQAQSTSEAMPQSKTDGMQYAYYKIHIYMCILTFKFCKVASYVETHTPLQCQFSQ